MTSFSRTVHFVHVKNFFRPVIVEAQSSEDLLLSNILVFAVTNEGTFCLGLSLTPNDRGLPSLSWNCITFHLVLYILMATWDMSVQTHISLLSLLPFFLKKKVKQWLHLKSLSHLNFCHSDFLFVRTNKWPQLLSGLPVMTAANTKTIRNNKNSKSERLHGSQTSNF